MKKEHKGILKRNSEVKNETRVKFDEQELEEYDKLRG